MKKKAGTRKPPANKPQIPAKTRVPPPRNLTPALCERLRRDMVKACLAVAETHGLTVEGGELADIDLHHGFDISFRVGIPMEDGTLFSHDKLMFEALAGSFGLEPSDYGRTFRTDGHAFRITAINPNRPKYPISAERIADGRGYKFSVENILAYLRAARG